MPPEADNKVFTVDDIPVELDTATIRADFPVLNQKVHDYPLVYLDSAASSQKPREVINALLDYYRRTNANIHRGIHTLAERATIAYEKTREHVAKFINADDPMEIVFTKGTTEAINLLAYAWGDANIKEGDRIVVTEMEHHANFVPWYQLAQRKKAEIVAIPITVCGHLDFSQLDELINERTKLVAVTHMSNVLGTINPIRELADKAHSVGALLLADGAQAAPHLATDVHELGCDFYVFSSHKMLGPTGVGVLWGHRKLLDDMPPFNFGGEMIREVRLDKVTFAELPHKFEAGTPNIADVVAFDAALSYLEKLGMHNIRHHEMQITGYTLERFSELPGVEIQGPQEVDQRGGAISFTDPDLHPNDISTYLDSKGIAIRAGHHCAQPLMRAMGKVATARASFYVYNDKSEVDKLVSALADMRKYFGL